MIGSRSKISGYRPNIQLKRQEIPYPPSSPFLVLKHSAEPTYLPSMNVLQKQRNGFQFMALTLSAITLVSLLEENI
jgi:hypothetical protein